MKKKKKNEKLETFKVTLWFIIPVVPLSELRSKDI